MKIFSEKGISQSFGIMVNYNYVLSNIESNNRHYMADGSIAVTSPVNETIQWATSSVVLNDPIILSKTSQVRFVEWTKPLTKN